MSVLHTVPLTLKANVHFAKPLNIIFFSGTVRHQTNEVMF